MTQAVNCDVQGTYLSICAERPFICLKRRRLPYGPGLSARISGRKAHRALHKAHDPLAWEMSPQAVGYLGASTAGELENNGSYLSTDI